MNRIRLLPMFVLIAFLLVFVKTHETIVHHFGSWLDLVNPASPVASVALAQDEEGEEGEDARRLGGFDEDAEWSPGERNAPDRITPTDISEMERTILQNLAERRKKLDEWSESIAMKENILNATEKKINLKLNELENLKLEVKTLLEQYSDRETKKIKRLVKMYETMKPKDAARIFDDMETSILLEIFDQMKEAKASPILAKMKSRRAQEITTLLAKQKKLTVSNAAVN